MNFTKELVDNLADKLLIGLTEEENKLVLDEFYDIDKNIDLINKIPNLNKETAMYHTLDDFEYELRCDEDDEAENIDDILKNCDNYEGREIVVPKVVG